MENQNLENKNKEVVGNMDNKSPQEAVQNNPVSPESPINPVLIDEAKKELEIKYAGFWIRFVAVIVDGIIVSIASAIVIAIMKSIVGEFYGANFFGYVITWAYYIFMTDRYQATLGKKLLGLKVVNEDFTKAPLGNIVLRETVGKIISSIILLIGYIMVAFNKKKRALHDIVSGTVVIRDSK